MSPCLLDLLTARRTHHTLKGDRDRIDAQLAASRVPMGRLRRRAELRSIAAAPSSSRCSPRTSARQAPSVPPKASAQSWGDSQLQVRPPKPRGPLPREACARFDGCDMGPGCVTAPA